MNTIGQDSTYGETALTSRVVYRSVSVVDPGSPPQDQVAVPVINTLSRFIDPAAAVSGSGADQYPVARRAWNAQLFLYASLIGGTAPSATVKVFTWGGTGSTTAPLYPLNEPEYAAANATGLTGQWALLGEYSLDSDGLFIPLRNITPSLIRVVCTAISGGGTLQLVEQHSV